MKSKKTIPSFKVTCFSPKVTMCPSPPRFVIPLNPEQAQGALSNDKMQRKKKRKKNLNKSKENAFNLVLRPTSYTHDLGGTMAQPNAGQDFAELFDYFKLPLSSPITTKTTTTTASAKKRTARNCRIQIRLQ